MTGRRWLLLALILVGVPVGAGAAQLEPKICADLKVELTLLQGKGIPADMAKGPEWAKTNLPRERLGEIERLIHVEEQLAFRCPKPRPPPAAGEDDDGTVAGAAVKGKGKAAPKAAAKAAKPAEDAEDGAEAKPKPKKAPAKAAAAPVESASDEPAKAPPRKAAAKPRAKAEDAYSPPTPVQGSNPVFKSN